MSQSANRTAEEPCNEETPSLYVLIICVFVVTVGLSAGTEARTCEDTHI